MPLHWVTGTHCFEKLGTNHPMTRSLVPEIMEITVFMNLNDTVLGIVDGLYYGFSPRYVLSPVSNAKA